MVTATEKKPLTGKELFMQYFCVFLIFTGVCEIAILKYFLQMSIWPHHVSGFP